MYAIIEDGSRQYKVSEGEVVRVDFRQDDTASEDRQGVPAGTGVEFPRVLLYRNGDDVRIGQPVVEGMRVLAEVVDHPSTKVMIQKFRRRKNYRRLRGHRQHYTSVRVKHILLPGQQAPTAATSPAPSQPAQPQATPAQAPEKLGAVDGPQTSEKLGAVDGPQTPMSGA